MGGHTTILVANIAETAPFIAAGRLRGIAVTSLERSDLLPEIPNGTIVVTESGIHDRAQVAALRARGVNAFLVGEAFMRDPDPGAALRRLFFD